MSKIVIVTGASRGIGRATALALAAGGHRLALAARNSDTLDALIREIGGRGGEALAMPTDVSDEGAVAQMVTATKSWFGRIDALVNAAGYGRFAPIHESETADWHTTMAANLTGTYLCCKHVIPTMLEQGSGQIINILSIAAKHAFPDSTAYCASKFGAYGLTLALAAEVRRKGIRVTALLPGAVDTPFWDAIGGGPDRAQMLRPEHVAETIRALIEQPEAVATDELMVMPPLGIL